MIKAQPIKVRVVDLIAKIKEAQKREEGRLKVRQEKLHQAHLDKIKEHQETLAACQKMTDDEYAETDYRFKRSETRNDFERTITMLEIASEPIITISSDSDLARFL